MLYLPIGVITLRFCKILDSTLFCLDSTIWLGSTLKLYYADTSAAVTRLGHLGVLIDRPSVSLSINKASGAAELLAWHVWRAMWRSAIIDDEIAAALQQSAPLQCISCTKCDKKIGTDRIISYSLENEDLRIWQLGENKSVIIHFWLRSRSRRHD